MRSWTLALAAALLPLAAAAAPLSVEIKSTTTNEATLNGVVIPSGTAYTFTGLGDTADVVTSPLDPFFAPHLSESRLSFSSASLSFEGFAPVTLSQASRVYRGFGLVSVNMVDEVNTFFGPLDYLIAEGQNSLEGYAFNSNISTQDIAFTFFAGGGGLATIATSGGLLIAPLSDAVNPGQFSVAVVPEPASALLTLGGLAALGWRLRQRRAG